MRNREQRRNSKKAEIRLRKKVGKAFDMMTKEEQANAFAAIMEATGKAQAELRRLQAEKEKHDGNTDDPGDDSICTNS
jgi:ribosome-associated translation inhibitor RaiA